MKKRWLVSLLWLPLSAQTLPLAQYSHAYATYQNTPSISAALALAQASMEYQAWDQVQALLDEILAKEPNQLDALLLQGKLYIALQKFPEAGEALGKILAYDAHAPQAQEAKKLVKNIAPNSDRFTSYYVASIKTGLDTNVNALNGDVNALNGYFTRIDSNVTKYSALASKADIFTELYAVGDYLHDVGDRGTYFATYGWQLHAKNYLEETNYNYLYWSMGAGFGVQTRWGQFHFPISMGGLSSHVPFYDPYSALSYDNLTYNTLTIGPAYSYLMQSGAMFEMGFIHLNARSQEQKSWYDSSTGASGTDAASYAESNMAYLGYTSKSYFDYYYQMRLYLHSKRVNEFENGTFGDYGQGLGFSGSYHQTLTALWSVDYFAQAETRTYFDHYLQGQFLPLDYNTETDPDRLLRKDFYAKFTVEVRYRHDRQLQSALGYSFANNHSNYTPQDYTKHEFYYALYWRP